MKTVYVIGSGKSAIELDAYREHITHSVGANYSYRLLKSPVMAFIDWMMWVDAHNDLERMDSEVHCVEVFHAPVVAQHPFRQPPAHFKRFQPYLAPFTRNPGPIWLSGTPGWLTSTWSVILPAINLAYLQKPDVIALIGVELDNTEHFWDCPEWPEIDARQRAVHGWCDPIQEYANPPAEGFPHQDTVLRNVAEIGSFLRDCGIRAVNCSQTGSVTGWERIPLSEMIGACDVAAC